MHQKNAARTALSAATDRDAATHRAAHQLLEHGRIFSDPLAVAILGIDRDDIVHQVRENPSSRRMRLFISIRTRFAEDALAAAHARGVRQLLVLGAGLDTYAYRSALPDGLRIFEVDHPTAQVWKREQLAAADIRLPGAPTYVPVDFERENCGEDLIAAGFDPGVPTFVTWLGVVPYLTEKSIWSTLGYFGSLPGGAEVVFDYSNPPQATESDQRAERRSVRNSELGDAWLSYFDTSSLHERLRSIGFDQLDDLGPGEIARQYLPGVMASVSDAGGHIMRATQIRRPA
jgi:methyltransferase (TIGR00027 family)